LTKEVRSDFFNTVSDFIEAWNRHDLDKLGDFYSDAVVSERSGRKLEGKEPIRRDRERLLKAFPDLAMDYRHQFSVGTHGVIEWRLRGTHKGIFDTVAGSFAPTGKCVSWNGIMVWEIGDDGLVIRERIYADTSIILQQLK
jgi:steroid delta-isomerase-like uncharacterized protein